MTFKIGDRVILKKYIGDYDLPLNSKGIIVEYPVLGHNNSVGVDWDNWNNGWNLNGLSKEEFSGLRISIRNIVKESWKEIIED